MMDYRENAGYIITDSCHVGDSEFVLGVHLTAPQQFVTWKFPYFSWWFRADYAKRIESGTGERND